MTSRDAAEPLTGQHDDVAARFTWLETKVNRELGAYSRRRRRDKRKAFVLKMGTVVLSATITVLLGVRVGGTAQQRLADVALGLGALVTVLAAAEAFFSHRGLWLLRTETARGLEALARHIEYYRAGLNGGPPVPKDVDRYMAELESILAKDYSGWRSLRQAADDGATNARLS